MVSIQALYRGFESELATRDLQALYEILESFGPLWDVRLFSDTEAAEYFTEQIFAGEFAGDLAQGVLRQPQIFRE